MTTIEHLLNTTRLEESIHQLPASRAQLANGLVASEMRRDSATVAALPAPAASNTMPKSDDKHLGIMSLDHGISKRSKRLPKAIRRT